MTKKKQPIRVYFTHDDPAALWRQGDTADDLGPTDVGSTEHLFRLDGFDDAKVVIEDPYGRGIVERLHDEEADREEDIPFVAEDSESVDVASPDSEVDLADRCARCSHVAAQHMPGLGSCGACSCRRFVVA